MISIISAWFYKISTKLSRFVLSASEEEPLLLELWNYFVDKYFTLHFEDYNYTYIDVSQKGIISLRGVILAVFFGIILASAISMFQKRTLGDLVRAIDRESAYSPEGAMTLAELGLLRASAIKYNLRRGTALRHIVRCVEEEAHNASQAEKRAAFEAQEANKGKAWREIPYRINFESDHFYIPEDKVYGAGSQFDKKGSSPWMFVLTIVLCVVLAALCCVLLPDILQMTDNFIGMLGGN